VSVLQTTNLDIGEEQEEVER